MVGDHDRALWAVDYAWCLGACAKLMADREQISIEEAVGRATGAQTQLVYSLLHNTAIRIDCSRRSTLHGRVPVGPLEA
jgi:hypothetical protein